LVAQPLGHNNKKLDPRLPYTLSFPLNMAPHSIGIPLDYIIPRILLVEHIAPSTLDYDNSILTNLFILKTSAIASLI